MSNLLEPDDIDFSIGGVEPGLNDHEEILRLIAEDKKRPEHAAGVARLRQTLVELDHLSAETASEYARREPHIGATPDPSIARTVREEDFSTPGLSCPLPPEPDDVEFVVGGVDEPMTAAETAQFIEEYKQSPEYLERRANAERVLADLGIGPPDYGLSDAQSLLDYWHRSVSDLIDEADGHSPAPSGESKRATSPR